MERISQKKVLYICQGAGFAGAESYALNLIKIMSRYKDMKCFAATCYNGPLADYLGNEQIETISLHGKSNLRSIIAVIKFVRSAGIDIIHCIDIKSTLVGGIASLFLNNIATVSTVHGLPEPYNKIGKQLRYTVSLIIYFGLLRFFFDSKICVSNELKERIKGVIGKKSVEAIHNGIDLGPDDNFPTDHTRESKLAVGTVGRLENVKGHIYLLSAAQMILSERADIVFYIIGSGPLEESLKETAQKLGLTKNVQFLGFRPDAINLLRNLDIFVLPSLHEGIPFVLLEAMASRKPVVCSNVGGIPEIVTNNSDGILVHPKDPRELYLAIKGLLENRDFMQFLGNNAYNKIQQNFLSSLMAEKTHSLYLKLLTP